MRKKILATWIILLLLFGLTGCGAEVRRYDTADYVLELSYKDDFRILQLSDTHLGNKDNRQKHYDFLTLTIEDADPDLIVLCGDIFTFADKRTAKELFAFLDGFGVPWTLTFGNHDEQCYFPIDWLTGYLNDFGSNCVFRDLQDDDVYGNANFAIDLKDGDSLRAQVILLDSNRYNYGEYWGYDYIKPDQIDWYERIVNDAAERNGGETVPSYLYFHIPFPEFEDAMQTKGRASADAVWDYGTIGEDASAPLVNTGFFNTIRRLGSTKAVSVAHDHVNSMAVQYKDVWLSYGVTSTDRIYYTEGMLGGTVMTIHPDGTPAFEQIFHSYDELEGGRDE